MVINDLHPGRTRGALRPFEANPPLIVHADAVLPLSISFQSFETVAGQRSEIFEGDGRFQTVQLQPCGAFDTRERLDTFAGREIRRPLVPITDNHGLG